MNRHDTSRYPKSMRARWPIPRGLERGGAEIDWIEPAKKCFALPWASTAAGLRVRWSTPAHNALDATSRTAAPIRWR